MSSDTGAPMQLIKRASAEAIDIFGIAVHPDADLFPMIPDDEMAELAEDIKANGLNESLVIARVSEEWVLVDGRNRREACRRAGIDPHYRILEADPKAYIVSANINRRHMTKGQRAMAVAMMYPETSQGKKTSLLNKEVNGTQISFARTILRTLPDLAPQVLAGAKPLNEAYQEAQAKLKASQSDEAKFARLKKDAPDLADLVVEERLTLAGAIADLEERERTKEAQLVAQLEFIHTLSQHLIGCSNQNGAELIRQTLQAHGERYQKRYLMDPQKSLQTIIQAFESAGEILSGLRGRNDEH